jgi:hypothetical protein
MKTCKEYSLFIAPSPLDTKSYGVTATGSFMPLIVPTLFRYELSDLMLISFCGIRMARAVVGLLSDIHPSPIIQVNVSPFWYNHK